MLSLCELCFPSASLVDTAMPRAYLSVHVFFQCQGGGDVGGRITDKWERVGDAVLIVGISLEGNTLFFLNGALHHHEIMLLISSFFFFLSLLTSLLYIVYFNLFPLFFHKLKYCLINIEQYKNQFIVQLYKVKGAQSGSFGLKIPVYLAMHLSAR